MREVKTAMCQDHLFVAVRLTNANDGRSLWSLLVYLARFDSIPFAYLKQSKNRNISKATLLDNLSRG